MIDERPLGVNPDLALTDEQATRLAALAAFDLEPVRQRLLRDGQLPPEWIDPAILEFRRYVGLSILGHNRMSMYSLAVDEVWHAALLFTQLYAEFCDQAVGGFLHHIPADGHEAGANPDAFARFRAVYEQTYGPLAPIWRLVWKTT